MKLFKRIVLSLLTLSNLLIVDNALAWEDKLLPPEQAFALTAWMERDNLIAEFRIAPGYYMYRKRFDFQVETGNARFDTPVIPDGKVKQDELFGEVETYRGLLRIVLPILFDSPRATSIKVKTTGQGCTDTGICYPPLNQSLAIDTISSAKIYPTAYISNAIPDNQEKTANLQALLSDATSNNTFSDLNPAVGSSDALSILQSLGEEIGLADEDEIPHPDTAFTLTANLDSNQVIQSQIAIYPNTYLYRDKTKVNLVEGSGHSVGAISLPEGKQKHDEYLGDTEVFYDQLNVSVPIISTANASESFTLSYHYQGCVEDRICYPPITKYLKVNSVTGDIQISDDPPAGQNTISLPQQASPSVTSIQAVEPVARGIRLSEQYRFAAMLKDVSLWSIMLFFLAGIALTFTPCVFPMIPILSSIIAGQGESITTRKAFSLSLVYVLSMAVAYAIVGAIVGYYGAEFNIQIWFQNPVVLGVFSGIFVLLALSMFGFYDIQMPTAIQSRLTDISNSQEGGTLIGVGLMGLFSAIIVGPCITAPLVGALIFISQTQNWQLGGLALFALGLGMGVPLLIIGTSAGRLLPRAGKWMNAINSVFGVALLAVAIWLLERILPVAITMALVAALLITSAIYMGALTNLNESASGWHKLNKGVGVLLLLYGAAYLFGAVSGSRDLLQPLHGIVQSGGGSPPAGEQHIQFRQIKGIRGLQQALDDSVYQQRATMLDFDADWCISCKVMERYAFTHPKVLDALADVNSIQTDVTANDAVDTEFMTSLGIFGPPAILFFDKNGNEIRHRRVVGEMSGEEFAEHILATFQVAEGRVL